MKHVEINNIIYPLQHGFRKRKSCETQLFTDDISHSLDYDFLPSNFPKRSTRSHSLLIHILDHYGAKCATNRWIRAFFTNITHMSLLLEENSSIQSSWNPPPSPMGRVFYWGELISNITKKQANSPI